MNEKDKAYIEYLIKYSTKHSMKKRRIIRNITATILLSLFPIVGYFGINQIMISKSKIMIFDFDLKSNFSWWLWFKIIFFMMILILCRLKSSESHKFGTAYCNITNNVSERGNSTFCYPVWHRIRLWINTEEKRRVALTHSCASETA